MGRGLFDYAEVNPTPAAAAAPQEAHRGPDALDAYHARRAAIDQSKKLMDAIEGQLEQGTPPQYVLYTALRLIALLTGAEDWEQRQRAALDAIYNDLAQESLFADNAATAAARLEDQRAQYIDKTRRKLKTIERETGTLYGLIQATLDHLGALEAGEEITTDPQTVYNGGGLARLHNQYLDKKARERKAKGDQ